ncbi:MAG TPA: hypothetical protein H9738_11260 [Candidatus Blautia pullistercoris]|uniref:Uncharacterized protein n=1 Tax=Candidatus Blautia pullistercoris TaxID=2838499 RepID=A0A9D1VNS2_9FIRM|nr:hypothetical protein [Clostridiales bacterium]HIX38426.1 hypothetical protein [Candidatus Blautia pullistercoris]
MLSEAEAAGQSVLTKPPHKAAGKDYLFAGLMRRPFCSYCLSKNVMIFG